LRDFGVVVNARDFFFFSTMISDVDFGIGVDGITAIFLRDA
jgi:hypothetical protein